MKTNLNINKIDLFQIDREKNNGPKKQIKESGYLSDSAPVKVDISSEAMERYRNSVQQNTPKVTELKECHILTDHHFDLSARINEINDRKGIPSVKDYAESMLEAYASLYADIVEGHQEGTRCIYTDPTADRPLTLEEDLAQLREAYESHAKFFEERCRKEMESDQMIEKSLRSKHLQSASDRAREQAESYLREIEARKEERKHVPANLSSQIIDAGRSFLSKVSALGNPDRNSMMNLITSMKMW